MNIGNKIPNLDKILREDDESDLMPAAGYVFVTIIFFIMYYFIHIYC